MRYRRERMLNESQHLPQGVPVFDDQKLKAGSSDSCKLRDKGCRGGDCE
jgi:hypothetical protein